MNAGNVSAKFDHGLVSVIMPCYNSSRFLKQAIDSVIAQTYQNWELILIDDCSDDGSVSIAEEYAEPRIHVLKNEKNSGAAISRNNGISRAKGRWIAFLDSDDLWDPEKLEQHLDFMISNRSAFSCTDYTVVDRDNKATAVFEPKKDNYGYKDILKHCFVGCSTAIYDTQKLGKVFMPEAAVKREDFACWLSILKTGETVSCLHRKLSKYRVYQGSVSSDKFKLAKLQWNVYRKVEHLPFFSCIYYMMHWAVKGFLKYR